MKAIFHGHAVVELITEAGTKIWFDPFIEGNPHHSLKVDEIKADVICLTHAHADHYGNVEEIAKNNDAFVIAPVELADYLAHRGVKSHGMQPGGSHVFDFGRITMTQAIHGSSLEINGLSHTLGLASGMIIEADDTVIYHVGDTALYSDMQWIGNKYAIDLAFIPIGDNYTMGPEDAVLAAQWLQAKHVVPIHYNTFPLIAQDPHAYVAQLGPNVGLVPEYGATIDF